MTMVDPLADMYTRIRNAVRVKKETVDIPSSKLKLKIAEIFKKEGYIDTYKFLEDNKQGLIRVKLRYMGKSQKPAINQIEEISKPGLRRYVNADSLPRVLNGYGTAVLTTSNGIYSDKECREKHVGGEVLCYIW